MKSVSSSVIFILVVIGMVLTAGIIIFWKWMQIQNTQANEFSCKIKQYSYCQRVLQGESENIWDEIEPKSGCAELGFARPSKEECKGF